MRHVVLVIAIVVCCVRAEDSYIRELEVLRDVRQVKCVYSDPNLVIVKLREMTDDNRIGWGSVTQKNCSGNITFLACVISASSIALHALVTDIRDGEARTFTCEASVLSGPGNFETRQLGDINVSKEVLSTRSQPQTVTATMPDFTLEAHSSQQVDRCELSDVLIIVIVFLAVSGLLIIILLVLYLRARREVLSSRDQVKPAKLNGHVTNGVGGQQVTRGSLYLNSRFPPPDCQAPDAPRKVSVMQYQRPLPLSSGGRLAQASDAEGQGQRGAAPYQEPWSRLDEEISASLAALRPNPRMCHVPGFQAKPDITDITDITHATHITGVTHVTDISHKPISSTICNLS
ncbi:uncharacterized protein LOC112569162 isoform X1 [Pomacea canaliculata]|uniref:uncharacterized protein LOC112569162 isoform X1 n=1 Tax=Pomacea canaliculata TaxID=400727 RepID=UPI000D732905|nr:uncharacterized protein LOC112569162 isoform X1 [Pomacea canaliculata]XP_025102668.1 uncharacterized protein LOC112569162 isoform X1 [Pomacea canaliculata]